MTMRLYYSPFSPYVRKCLVVAIELNLEKQFELIRIDLRAVDTGYEKINPLSRIPALELEDGSVLFDSPVICEYLNHLGNGALIPDPGPSRWHALKLQAMGDGIMDAAVPRRQESLRPDGERSPYQLKIYQRSIMQTLDALESITAQMKQVTLGTLSVACALGYLDFRFADDQWREGRPKLAAWSEKFAARSSLSQTIPIA